MGRVETRFWAKVDRSGGDEACWPWIGARNPDGYGHLRGAGRVMRQATHVVLEIAGRPLLPGQIALHSCDNPPCANPRHLRGGTQAENLSEMSDRGRSYRGGFPGEANGRAVLTEAAVAILRQRRSEGLSLSRLAAMFGVSKSTVWSAVSGTSWRHQA